MFLKPIEVLFGIGKHFESKAQHPVAAGLHHLEPVNRRQEVNQTAKTKKHFELHLKSISSLQKHRQQLPG
jgi:hypothetical protein